MTPQGANPPAQESLSAALGQVRAALQRRAEAPRRAPESAVGDPRSGIARTREGLPPEPLQQICAAFGLSAFERDLLVLCAGAEIDSRIGALCGSIHGDPARAYPSFSIALSAIPQAHWSAVMPSGPLRRWRLVEAAPAESLVLARLRIDEHVLHFLMGAPFEDERIASATRAVLPPAALVASHREAAQSLLRTWSAEPAAQVLLTGPDPRAREAIVAWAAAQVRRTVRVLHTPLLPAADVEGLARLWERQARLTDATLLLECGDAAAAAHSPGELAARLQVPVVVGSRDPAPASGAVSIVMDIGRPTAGEQARLWVEGLPPGALSPAGAEHLANQFDFGVEQIHSAVRSAALSGPITPEGLWRASLAQCRPALEPLARRIRSDAGWESLVLPESALLQLRHMASHVRHRARVFGEWGLRQGGRGLGTTALFTGGSGTGKTLAAEVLANELRLDLYQVDLSAIISKYIGETEKNLRQVFDAAEGTGCLLLFDEADALFGKRTEVKDSHDRYANVEVSYLLQRMEAYRGLSILTTNLRSALDPAFLRRIRFVIPFPFPEAAQRAEIWRRMFPPQTPTAPLDWTRLAQLNLAGGNLRNVAVNAAFLAAEAEEPLGMVHVLRAARMECAKLERPLTTGELEGWV